VTGVRFAGNSPQIPHEIASKEQRMKRISTRTLVGAMTFAVCAALTGSAAIAQDPYGYGYGYGDSGYYPGNPKLFRNYYVGGPEGQGAPAQLYVSPRPVPAYVGHTWITYEPLMPHEFLYAHHRHYYAHHADGSCTHTKVKWCATPSLPFVRTLNAGGPIIGTRGLIPEGRGSALQPWQNPAGLMAGPRR
jgi:hypothetical protein